jgi:hypothetical protein
VGTKNPKPTTAVQARVDLWTGRAKADCRKRADSVDPMNGIRAREWLRSASWRIQPSGMPGGQMPGGYGPPGGKVARRRWDCGAPMAPPMACPAVVDLGSTGASTSGSTCRSCRSSAAADCQFRSTCTGQSGKQALARGDVNTAQDKIKLARTLCIVGYVLWAWVSCWVSSGPSSSSWYELTRRCRAALPIDKALRDGITVDSASLNADLGAPTRAPMRSSKLCASCSARFWRPSHRSALCTANLSRYRGRDSLAAGDSSRAGRISAPRRARALGNILTLIGMLLFSAAALTAALLFVVPSRDAARTRRRCRLGSPPGAPPPPPGGWHGGGFQPPPAPPGPAGWGPPPGGYGPPPGQGYPPMPPGGPSSQLHTVAMVLGILAIVGMIIGFIPCLGWFTGSTFRSV